jgi:hypothetical protein
MTAVEPTAKTFSSYRGMGGMVAQIEMRENRPALLTVLDGLETVVFTHPIHVRNPSTVPSISEGASPTPVILLYERAAIHPAGDQAPISWVNGEGRGLLRIVNPGKQVLLLPLIGSKKSLHEPIAPRAGKRGPSRSSDLWLIISGWCQPFGFTASSMSDITGISSVTVWKWIHDMEDNGYIAENPQSNQKTYVLRFNQREALANLVMERWSEWRRGTGIPSLRPTYYFFTANDEWKQLRERIRNQSLRCFPSGITVLEGGPECGPKSWITSGGLLPELNLYVAASDQGRLAEAANLVLRRERERSDDSTLCVLRDDHPAMRLYVSRREALIYSNPWPWGLAALDAMDHHDPRVIQAAREAWREWAENQEIESFRDPNARPDSDSGSMEDRGP